MPLARRNLADVTGDDCGYCVTARSFAFGVTSHGLVATVAWGTFDERDAFELGTAWTKTLTGPKRDSLVEVTHLAMSDSGAFATFRQGLETQREARARVVRRQAIVARHDFGGMFVRGYLALYPPPYEVGHFDDRVAALEWLGHPCCDAEIDELDEARLDLLVTLRCWLDRTNLAEATIERAVVELAVTARTLQRRLAAAGTRFPTEVARVQVSRAQRLMLDPSRKLSDIALEVGCATPSSFSDLFRRITGETPSEWRRRPR